MNAGCYTVRKRQLSHYQFSNLSKTVKINTNKYYFRLIFIVTNKVTVNTINMFPLYLHYLSRKLRGNKKVRLNGLFSEIQKNKNLKIQKDKFVKIWRNSFISLSTIKKYHSFFIKNLNERREFNY